VPLSERDKQAVWRRAGYRCEYCRLVGWELQVEHIVPRSPRRRATGGASGAVPERLDDLENLAAACAHCNRLKGDFVTGRDPLSGREVRLFDPRRDDWDEHFSWSSDYLHLLPLSDIGGATVARLRANDPILVRQRRLLRRAMAAGGFRWP
jgi:hypothetical protein